MNRCIILQGIPGSGKSTYIKHNHPTAVVCSADHYFIGEDGEYRFDPTKIGEAHAACLRKFLNLLQAGTAEVVVDNTNISRVEMAPYVQAAVALGYEVEVVRIQCSPQVATDRNIHGVPPGLVVQMFYNLERPINYWKCTYKEVS